MIGFHRAVLCAAAALCASPAAAAVSFTISPNAAVGFGTDSNLLILDFTATSSVATNFDVTLTGYDLSTCNAGNSCVPFDRNRVSIATVNLAPGATTTSLSLSFLAGSGPVINRNVLFSTTGASEIRITNLTTRIGSLVPEPSTWALMLAGFGLVGYAMRRRRAVFA